MAFWALVLGSVIFFKQKTISLSQTFPGTSWKRFHGGRLFDWGLGPLRFFFFWGGGAGSVGDREKWRKKKAKLNRNLIDFCWRVMHICLFVWFVCLVSLFWERAWPYWALLEGSYMPSCQLRYHRVTWYQAWYIVIWIDSVSFVRKHVLFFFVVMEFTSINTFRLYFNWFFYNDVIWIWIVQILIVLQWTVGEWRRRWGGGLHTQYRLMSHPCWEW